jgi:hypothetical protein
MRRTGCRRGSISLPEDECVRFLILCGILTYPSSYFQTCCAERDLCSRLARRATCPSQYILPLHHCGSVVCTPTPSDRGAARERARCAASLPRERKRRLEAVIDDWGNEGGAVARVHPASRPNLLGKLSIPVLTPNSGAERISHGMSPAHR